MLLHGLPSFPPSGYFPVPEPWVTYLLECADASLYCGVTNNLARRIARHACGQGGRYTAAHLPVRLMMAAVFPDKRSAMRAENLVKAARRVDKYAVLQQLCAAAYKDF